MRNPALALAILLAIPLPAAADEFTTSELLAIADGGDDVDRLYFESYAVGLAEGVEMSHQVASSAGVAFFCPEAGLLFGGALVLDVLREQMAWYPQAAAMEPRVVFFTGLIKRYPCDEQLGLAQ
jgi:hypothetical protein